MCYYDNLLDVYAYLENEECTLKGKSMEFMDRQEQLHKRTLDINKTANKLEQQLYDYAKQNGIMLPQNEKKQEEFVHKEILSLIHDDTDKLSYEELVKKAHAHGFCNTRLEWLLSEEEIKHAQLIHQSLDSEFSLRCEISPIDMTFLMEAAILQTLRFFILDIIANNNITINSVNKMKSWDEILKDSIPFMDVKGIEKKQPLGMLDKVGWLFGIANILTDTVTVKPFSSYQIKRGASVMVSTPINTITQVFGPLLSYRGDVAATNSLIAAILRETEVQRRKTSGLEQLRENVAQTFHRYEVMKKANHILQNTACINEQQLGFATAIDAVIQLLHITRYDPQCDGDINTYMVRTNKIITISNVLATSFTSIVQSYYGGKPDFAGMETCLVDIVHSARFWINAKAEFLEKHFMNQVDQLNEQADALLQFYEQYN